MTKHNSHRHDHHDHQGNHHNGGLTTPISDPSLSWKNWLPLMVVIGFIIGLTTIFAVRTEFTTQTLLSYSMGFFFVLFSLFKLIDLPGFAMGYHEYDLISKRWYNWSYLYPFIELALGAMYLLVIDNPLLHLATIVFSAIVCVGVGIKLAKHELFQCACLGTVLKVPLTKISLVEYAVMAVMALAMLIG